MFLACAVFSQQMPNGTSICFNWKFRRTVCARWSRWISCRAYRRRACAARSNVADPADAVGGMDPEMIRLAREMHTPLVRFGGNFTSAYHWRDGVGSADKRVSMLNIAWGIPETNPVRHRRILTICQTGAEPQIALNLGSGTAEEAAAWVRYVNDRWPSHTGVCYGNWKTSCGATGISVLRRLKSCRLEPRSFSEAIHQVDPRARLIATGQDPDQYTEWNAAQLTNPPGTFDFLSTHFVVTWIV